MADESYELAVALQSEGADETQSALEETEAQFDDTAEQVGDSADEMEGFAQKWQGAMTAIVGGLSIAAAGLLSQVPVIGESMAGLEAVIAAVAFQMDQVLRPALQPLNQGLFALADAIFQAEGPMGALVGALGTVATAVVLAAGAIAGLGAALPSLTAAGALGSAVAGLKAFGSAIAGFIASSVAAAAAVGAFAGLLGVAVLEVTGVLDAVRRLGQQVGQVLPSAVSEGMLAVVGFFIGPLAAIGAAITGFVSGVLEGGLSEGIDRAVSNARQVLGIFTTAWSNTIDRVVGFVNGLIDDAFGFGVDLVDEFVSGIRSMIDEVAAAAGDVAQAARDRLPSSPAAEGPLQDLDKTGPALAETFAAGMGDGIRSVEQSAASVAGAGASGGSGGGGGDGRPRFSSGRAPIQLAGKDIQRETGRVDRDDTARRGI